MTESFQLFFMFICSSAMANSKKHIFKSSLYQLIQENYSTCTYSETVCLHLHLVFSFDRFLNNPAFSRIFANHDAINKTNWIVSSLPHLTTDKIMNLRDVGFCIKAEFH